ncbi:opsin-5-like [Saccoglossus kowalevskii]|uniref:Opsin-5-like n=1 Tax=Saccoglossus kowalevskii TaxID=10224 RepID=A0ABM0MGN3_SACKO|nr:PREDICTED: opsin-5-like [Saccoglossus kowalevskii]
MAIGTYLTSICLLSLFGNVIYLASKFKQRKQLKIPDYLLANIAIADIGAVTTSYMLAAISSFSTKWRFGSIGCTLTGFSGWFFNCVSMITLAVVAIVRRLLVVNNHGVGARAAFSSMYTFPLGSIIEHHGLSYHLYADDTQLYISFQPNSVYDRDIAMTNLKNCVSELKD